MENNDNVYDEISLIDLFSVLIKFRKLICIITFLLTVFIFIFGLLNKKISMSVYNVEYNIPIINNERINVLLNYDLSSDLILKFSNLYTIANLTKELPLFYFNAEDSFFDENDYNYFIKKQQIKNNYLVSINENESAINIFIKTKYLENVDLFIKTLIDRFNIQYELILQPLVVNRLFTLDSLIKDDKLDFDKSDIISEYIYLQDLNKTKLYVLDENPTSFIFRESNFSYLILFFIAFFASLFISIFIAFFINAIKNIKSDAVASEKIKSAWESGKKILP